MDAAAIKERQREIWRLGDYSFSRVLRPAAAELGATAGSWEAARRALPSERFDAMEAEFTELVRCRGGEGPVRIDNEYVVIVARRRG